MIELQRIGVKILTDAPAKLNLDPLLSIFGRWRTETDHPAQWVDLADYAHMPRGPGVVLVGKRANFSFDMSDPAPGPLYVSKKDLSGAPAERLGGVFRASFAFAERLAAEAEFPAGVRLDTSALEVVFNDRLETPNNGSTDAELRSVVSAVADRLFGRSGYELERRRDAGDRYGFSIRAARPPEAPSG